MKILCMDSSHAQYFHAMPPGFNFQARALFADTTDNSVYAGGNFWMLADSTPMNCISKWNGTYWDSLGSGLFGFVSSIVRFNDTIYAAGSFAIPDTVLPVVYCNIAKWNGNKWVVPKGGAANEAVYKLRVYNGNLYAMGLFSTIGGIAANCIARFDGNQWYSFPALATAGDNILDCIFYNGELYAGGDFSGGTGKKDIAKFDGVSWQSVGGGFASLNALVVSFNIFQNKLIVGGYFQTNNGDPGNNIAMWDGLVWSQAGAGITGNYVAAMSVFNNELYVSGNFTYAGSVPVTNIAKWDGMQWQGLNAIFDNGILDLCVLNIDLYMIGGFMQIDNDSMHYVTRYSPPTAINEVSNCKESSYTISNLKANAIKVVLTNLLAKKYSITSVSGELLIKNSLTPTPAFLVDIKSLANGLYVLTIETGTEIMSKQFVKMR